jgi:peroxiredoxin
VGIQFPLLRDADLKVANAYGVAMKGKDIAVPAVFVISREGRIVFKAIGESPADRASLSDILAAVDASIASSKTPAR